MPCIAKVHARTIVWIAFATGILAPSAWAQPRPAPIEAPHYQKKYERLYPDRIALLIPNDATNQPGDRPFAFAYAGRRLEALDLASGKPLWDQPFLSEAQPVIRGIDAGRLYVTTRHQALAVARATGRSIWEFGRAPPTDTPKDPEFFTSWIDGVLTPAALCLASDRGEIVCLSRSSGDLVWRKNVTASISAMATDGERIFFAGRRGARQTLAGLDAKTGEVEWEIGRGDADGNTSGNELIQTIVTTSAGPLMSIGSRQITAIDPITGHVIWRQTTEDLCAPATLVVINRALFIADARAAMHCFELDDGRMRWHYKTHKDSDAPHWAAAAGERLLVASHEQLACLDPTSGLLTWRIDLTDMPHSQPPLISNGSVIAVTLQTSAKSTRPATTRPAARDERRYQIRRLNLMDGRNQPLSIQGPLISESLASPGGVHLIGDMLIILDANRLIGYAPATQNAEPSHPRN